MVEDFLEFSGGFAEAVTFPATIVTGLFGIGAKTMAYYRVDALSIEELGRICPKLAGWSTGKLLAIQ